jgi:hypothetical protein
MTVNSGWAGVVRAGGIGEYAWFVPVGSTTPGSYVLTASSPATNTSMFLNAGVPIGTIALTVSWPSSNWRWQLAALQAMSHDRK